MSRVDIRKKEHQRCQDQDRRSVRLRLLPRPFGTTIPYEDLPSQLCSRIRGTPLERLAAQEKLDRAHMFPGGEAREPAFVHHIQAFVILATAPTSITLLPKPCLHLAEGGALTAAQQLRLRPSNQSALLHPGSPLKPHNILKQLFRPTTPLELRC